MTIKQRQKARRVLSIQHMNNEDDFGLTEITFNRLPFEGRPGRIATAVMRFYQRRLVTLAKNRAAAGRLGEINSGWRELYDGFVPDFRLRKQFAQGLRRWWSAEVKNLVLSTRRVGATTSAATAHPSEA